MKDNEVFEMDSEALNNLVEYLLGKYEPTLQKLNMRVNRLNKLIEAKAPNQILVNELDLIDRAVIRLRRFFEDENDRK